MAFFDVVVFSDRKQRSGLEADEPCGTTTAPCAARAAFFDVVVFKDRKESLRGPVQKPTSLAGQRPYLAPKGSHPANLQNEMEQCWGVPLGFRGFDAVGLQAPTV